MSQHTLILGMGGSGKSAARLALSLGHSVYCVDQRTSNEPVACRHILEDQFSFEEIHIDQIVVSPGVPSSNRIVQEALSRKIPILSELNFASQQTTLPILAITGTNGKSSTAWYTHQMTQALGERSFIGGNFGTALSEAILELQTDPTRYTLLIVEVSSYQMEWSTDFHPVAATLLNLTPDHLARHGTMDEYKRCKQKLFQHQSPTDWAILPINQPELHPESEATVYAFGHLSEHTPNTLGCFWDKDTFHWFLPALEASNALPTHHSISRASMNLFGEHNAMNVAAAWLLVSRISPKAPFDEQLLSQLTPLVHRLEPILSQGRLWINDSKATNIEATQAALQSMEEPTTLLLGGAGKEGAEYGKLLPLIHEKVRRIICFGASGLEIQTQLQQSLSENIPCVFSLDLSSAIELARLNNDHTPVLLSPACASFDEFTNFEHRGNVFKDLVLSH